MSERENIFIFSLNFPDYLTISSFIVGISSIYLISQGYLLSSVGILFVAMILDAFDGHFARKRNIVREFGISLDSFVDTSNYLILPAIILYKSGMTSILSILCLILFYLSGIIRLSVFNNVQPILVEGKLKYSGLPVFWSLHITGSLLILDTFLPIFPWFATIVVLTISFLFVYNKPWKKFTNMRFILLISLIQGIAFLVLDFIEL